MRKSLLSFSRDLLSIFCLIFSTGLAHGQVPVNINSGNPAFPFPQFLEYKVGKNLGTDPAPGITHADMEKGIREAYQIMMNRAIYTSETAGGVKYIIFNPGSIPEAGPQPFCSEGDGYALIAAALMGDKTTFDGLFMATHDYKFKKVKRFLDCVNQGMNYLPNPLPGVYDRKIDEVGTNSTGEASTGGTHDSAADGDWDIAMGLILGARQWGEKSGIIVCGEEINYRKEALTMMRALTDTLKAYQNLDNPLTAGPTGKYYSGNIGFDGYAKSGNTFGEMTNWATATGFGKPKFTGPSSQFFDYMGSGYFQVFAEFLEDEKQSKNTIEYDWAIFQFKRARASTNWLLEQTYNDGYLPYVGGVSLTPSNTLIYDTYPTSTSPIGEDFRLPWRNLADLLWHGTPDYTWDPVNHQIKAGTTNALAGHAQNMVNHLNKPSVKSGDGCIVLGQFPGVFASVDGPVVIAQGVSKTGASMGQLPQTRGMNWIHGVSSAAPVIAEDINLAAYMYQQCEIDWDATPDLNALAKDDPRRYEKSTPKYFHEFFRLIGMLTLSGNYYPPNDISAKPNVKTYLSIDKTFGFPKDEVKYVIKYRNYGSAAASGFNVNFDVPAAFDVISASKGTVSGNSINYTASLAAVKGDMVSMDSIIVRVKVRTDATNGRYCAQAIVSGTGFDTHVSSEYPNNATYTMERNCFDVVTRSLAIEKIADKEVVNPGDIVTYKVNFENSSKAGWLDGGRPGVKFTYGQNINSTDSSKVTKFDIFLRIGHGAHESYINLKNYRVSYYLNETAIDKVVTDKSQLGWYLGTHHYYDGDDIDKMTLANQIIPFGELANGKKWNQRLIFKFSEDVISAPTMHLFQQTNNFHRIHKGTGYPFIAYLQMETAGSSLNYGDDWSFDNKNAVPNEKDANVSIVLPDNSDPYKKDVMDKKFNPFSCSELSKVTDKILVEEFDGYGWRRILGNGPIPGREAEKVVVIDSLPQEVKWGGFNVSKAIGIEATYDPACHCITWKKDALLVAEKGKIEYWVTVKNASEMGKSCPLEIDMLNKASISALSESPLVAQSMVHITCGALPPPKPSKTSMYKTSDKTSYAVGEKITYNIAYKQTQGTIAKPDLLTNTDWTTANTTPTFSSQGISFGGNSEYVQYDYSHGKNGDFDLELEITNASSIFSVLLRNNTGSPKTTPFTGVGFQVHPGPWGMDKGAIISVFNGIIIVAETDGFKPYGATSSLGIMKIHIELIEDVMRIWINKDYTVDAPTLTANGLNVQTGYLAYYNDKVVAFNNNNAYGASGPGIKIKAWNSNFDSAFDVKLWDLLPAEVSYISSSAQKLFTSPGFTPQIPEPVYNSSTKTIEWILKSGKVPMLYGDSVSMKFEATVLNCGPGFITNTAYVDVLGQPSMKIGAQNVSTCGAPSTTCTPPTTATATTANTTLCLGSPLTINGAASPANTNYYYTWYKGTTPVTTPSKTYTPLSIAATVAADAGIYKLRVEDGDAGNATCYKESAAITITIDAPVTAATISADQTICTGTSPAQLGGPVAAGGSSTATATYVWERSVSATGPWTEVNAAVAKDYTPGNLTATTYYRRVDKKGSCDSIPSNVVAISVSPTLLAGTIDGVQTICTNTIPDTLNNVTLASGGTGTYTYQWQVSEDNVLFTDILNATDEDYVPTSPISVNKYYRRKVTSGTTAPCNVNQTGSVLVSVSQAVVPEVSITADDTTICSNTLVTFNATAVNGGATPTFEWFVNNVSQSTGTSKQYVKASLANNDEVTVKMNVGKGCADPSIVTSPAIIMVVSDKVDPSISIDATSTEICSGDAVTFSVASQQNEGTNPVYQWYIGNSLQIGENGPSFSPTIINDGDLVKAILTSDANCLQSNDVESNVITMKVSSNLDPKVFIAADPVGDTVVCSGQSVKFAITGAVAKGTNPQYQWYVNGGSILGQTDSIFTFTPNDGDLVKVEMKTNSSCATNSNVESKEISMDVIPVVTPSLSIIASGKTTLCPGETVNLTIDQEANMGNAIYQWKVDGADIPLATSNSLVVNQSGNYTLEATSSLKCVTASTVESSGITVNQSVLPAFSITSAKTEICSYESLTLSSNLVVKDWVKDLTVLPGAGGSNSLDIKLGGSYFAIYENAEGCLDSSNVISINQAPENNVTLMPASADVCSGGTVLLESSVTNPSNTYTWLDESNATIKQGTESTHQAGAGSYTLIVDNGSCKDTSNTVSIVEKVLTTPVISGDPNPYCSMTSQLYIVSNASPGSQYTWTVPSGATIVFGQGTSQIIVDFGDQDGNITVTESVSGNCSGIPATFAISLQKCDLKADFTASDFDICSGDEVTLSNTSTGISPSATYTWEFGANANPTSANGPGPHIVKYTGTGSVSPKLIINDGIQVETSKSISLNPLPASPNIDGPSTICLGSAVNYTTSSTGNLTWYLNGGNVEFGFNKNTYPVTAATLGNALVELSVVDGFGCSSDTTQKTISVIDAPIVSISSSANAICTRANGFITLSGATGSIEWFKDGIKIPNANGTTLPIESGGSYFATVQGTCFQNTETLVINEIDFTINAGKDVIVDIDQSVQLNAVASHPVVTYAWSPSLQPVVNPIFTPYETTEYTVTAISMEGCIANDKVLVTVVRPLFIPNAFTPNGDGNHDVWEVTGLERYGDGVTVSIYNRWGAVVYQGRGAYFQWNGKNKGVDMPVATYYYVIEPGGDAEPITGSVLLSK